MTQGLRSVNLSNAVATKSTKDYATEIEKAEDSKDKAEESIFKVQNVSYSTKATSSKKSEDSDFKQTNTSNPINTSSTISALESLISSLTSLIEKLNNEQEEAQIEETDYKPDEDDEDKPELTTAAKANDDNQNVQKDEKNSNGVTKVTDENIMRLLADDGFDTTSFKPADLADILGYDSEYKDGKIVCMDGNGTVIKYYTVTENGCKCFNRYGDKFYAAGMQGHTLPFGDNIKTPFSRFVNDGVVYYGLSDLDSLKQQGFDVRG